MDGPPGSPTLAGGTLATRPPHAPGPMVSREGCTKSRYQIWLVSDAKHKLADEVRRTKADLRTYPPDEQANVLAIARRTERIQELKGQTAKSADAVRSLRMAIGTIGAERRESSEAIRQLKQQQRADWLTSQRNGTIKQFGDNQRRKMLSAQQKAIDEKRAAVIRCKEEQRERVLASRAELATADELKRSEIERLQREGQVPFRAAPLSRVARKETEGMSEGDMARYHFFRQKQAAAAEVRSAMRDWESMRRQEAKHLHHVGRQARAKALASRKGAQYQRQAALEARQQEATAMRARSQQMEGRRRATVLATALGARAAVHEAYHGRFMPDEIASEIAATEYGSPDLILSNVHGQGRSPSSSPLHRVSGLSGLSA